MPQGRSTIELKALVRVTIPVFIVGLVKIYYRIESESPSATSIKIGDVKIYYRIERGMCFI